MVSSRLAKLNELPPRRANTNTHRRPPIPPRISTGIIKFLTLDVKTPNYPLIMMQLEQQLGPALEQQPPPVALDLGQSLAGDQSRFQKRIFGEYRSSPSRWAAERLFGSRNEHHFSLATRIFGRLMKALRALGLPQLRHCRGRPFGCAIEPAR